MLSAATSEEAGAAQGSRGGRAARAAAMGADEEDIFLMREEVEGGRPGYSSAGCSGSETIFRLPEETRNEVRCFFLFVEPRTDQMKVAGAGANSYSSRNVLLLSQ
jgi:hypothetical protein